MRNSRKKAGGRRRLLRYYSAGLQTDANNRHLCHARQSYRNIFSDWPQYVFSAIGMTGYVLRNIKKHRYRNIFRNVRSCRYGCVSMNNTCKESTFDTMIKPVTYIDKSKNAKQERLLCGTVRRKTSMKPHFLQQNTVYTALHNSISRFSTVNLFHCHDCINMQKVRCFQRGEEKIEHGLFRSSLCLSYLCTWSMAMVGKNGKKSSVHPPWTCM